MVIHTAAQHGVFQDVNLRPSV